MIDLNLILLWLGVGSWLLALCVALTYRQSIMSLAASLNAFGCVCLIILSLIQLIDETHVHYALFDSLANGKVIFSLDGSNAWLLFFGLITAFFISILGHYQVASTTRNTQWYVGLSMSLLGALGVFSLQDAMSFLIAWELMSLGGALMVLSVHDEKQTHKNVFFMLALLETGAVAILLGLLILSAVSGTTAFSMFRDAIMPLNGAAQFFVGLLFVIGFGAKLGVLPFYEWFPGAYGSTNGATGALFSGLILNAAVYATYRVLIDWLPANQSTLLLGIFVGFVAVISAVMAALFAFQQRDWRRLLSLSSAENACIALLLLSASLICKQQGLVALSAMASVIAMMHMAAHCLAKGCLFLVADAHYRIHHSYDIHQTGLGKQSLVLMIGSILCVMSLSAIPPTFGFLNEWYSFQLFFHGFDMPNAFARVSMALFGAGLALSSAVALAVFVKLFGIGMLGRPAVVSVRPMSARCAISVFVLGLLSLIMALGMPWFIGLLNPMSNSVFYLSISHLMHVGWVMVPLTKNFAFISPPMLMISLVAFSLFPLVLLLSCRRFSIRRAPLWCGGDALSSAHAGNALTFSNALRKFYAYVYSPKESVVFDDTTMPDSLSNDHHQVVGKIIFKESFSYYFIVKLITPISSFSVMMYKTIRRFQSGNVNHYNLVFLVLIALILLASFI